MKKILTSLMFLLFGASVLFATDYSCFDNLAVGIDGFGQETTGGTFFVSSGIINVHETWTNPAAKNCTSSANMKSQTVAISTTALVASGTTYTLAKADFTDMAYPRNVYAVLGASTTTDSDASTVSGTLTITGKNRYGATITDTVTVSTQPAVSTKVFFSVTSMALSAVTISGWEVAVNSIYFGAGFGDKFALANDITDSTNIKKVLDTGAVSTGYTMDYTYDAITWENAADGSCINEVWYQAEKR